MKPTRPALRYYGGKWRLAPWIISHFPDHDCYVEPFGGAMSVLLRKRPSYIEVYNDLDQDVVTFFRVLRERTVDLIRAIRLTPFARAELALSYKQSDDDLERARRIYIRAVQAIGGPRTEWASGWRFQKRDAHGKRSVDDWADLEHLCDVADRLRMVYLECDDAMTIIKRYDEPTTLFYCDPPYPNVTRSKWAGKAYKCEMTDSQHVELAHVLMGIKGMAIVSSYPSEMYTDLYGDWKQVTRLSRVNTIRNGGALATECLWLSPTVTAKAVQKAMF